MWTWVGFSLNPANDSCRKHFGHAFSRSLSAQISYAGSVIKVWNALVAPAMDVTSPFNSIISVCFRLRYKSTMWVRELRLLPPRSPSLCSIKIFHWSRRQKSRIAISSLDHQLQSSVADPHTVFSNTSAAPGVCKRGLTLAEEVSTSYANGLCAAKKEHTRNISF
jgi:hypothetical protein